MMIDAPIEPLIENALHQALWRAPASLDEATAVFGEMLVQKADLREAVSRLLTESKQRDMLFSGKATG